MIATLTATNMGSPALSRFAACLSRCYRQYPARQCVPCAASTFNLFLPPWSSALFCTISPAPEALFEVLA
jgi:hypothetical protein